MAYGFNISINLTQVNNYIFSSDSRFVRIPGDRVIVRELAGTTLTLKVINLKTFECTTFLTETVPSGSSKYNFMLLADNGKVYLFSTKASEGHSFILVVSTSDFSTEVLQLPDATFFTGCPINSDKNKIVFPLYKNVADSSGYPMYELDCVTHDFKNIGIKSNGAYSNDELAWLQSTLLHPNVILQNRNAIPKSGSGRNQANFHLNVFNVKTGKVYTRQTTGGATDFLTSNRDIYGNSDWSVLGHYVVTQRPNEITWVGVKSDDPYGSIPQRACRIKYTLETDAVTVLSEGYINTPDGYSGMKSTASCINVGMDYSFVLLPFTHNTSFFSFYLEQNVARTRERFLCTPSTGAVVNKGSTIQYNGEGNPTIRHMRFVTMRTDGSVICFGKDVVEVTLGHLVGKRVPESLILSAFNGEIQQI